MSHNSEGTRTPLLRVEKVVKRFGGFCALDEVSFHLLPGEILGLVGPNGSGKTTCINVISGLYRPDAGQVLLDERPIGGLPSHKLVHLGINRTFQVPKPFLSLTVQENVEVAAAYGRRHRDAMDIDTILGTFDLIASRSQPAAALNSVQQKMLDLARALATAPRILLIDELAAGLNPEELRRVAAHLRELADSGIALVVVEHLMGFIGEVTDRVIVLNAGHEIFEGKLDDAVRDRQVIEVFLGVGDAA
jgi:branched-chain amino acid transport system ATP-binding protein